MNVEDNKLLKDENELLREENELLKSRLKKYTSSNSYKEYQKRNKDKLNAYKRDNYQKKKLKKLQENENEK